jgi:excisionase family DNA binding protein
MAARLAVGTVEKFKGAERDMEDKHWTRKNHGRRSPQASSPPPKVEVQVEPRVEISLPRPVAEYDLTASGLKGWLLLGRVKPAEGPYAVLTMKEEQDQLTKYLLHLPSGLAWANAEEVIFSAEQAASWNRALAAGDEDMLCYFCHLPMRSLQEDECVLNAHEEQWPCGFLAHEQCLSSTKRRGSVRPVILNDLLEADGPTPDGDHLVGWIHHYSKKMWWKWPMAEALTLGHKAACRLAAAPKSPILIESRSPEPKDTVAAGAGSGWISASDVAQRLGVGRSRVYALAREGLLPVVRLGRLMQFSEQAIEHWLQQGGAEFAGGWRKEAR